MRDEVVQFPLTPLATRRHAIVGAAIMFGGLAAGTRGVWAAPTDEIYRSDESIHQELVFPASREIVYQTLTDTAKFDKMTREIQAREGGNNSSALPTQISRDVGGTFTLFGGRIVGRHLELLPNERIVQAWRVAYWQPGIFSIVRFDLAERGSDAKILFSHAAFPKGDAANLVEGWKLHYWQPLEKFLGHTTVED